MQSEDTRVTRSILITNRSAAIGRTIINKDNFQILVALRQDRIDTLTQVRLYLVDGDDDGKFHLYGEYFVVEL